MIRFRTLGVAIAAVTLSQPIVAQTVTVAGVGTMKCSDWTYARKSKEASPLDNLEQWVLGYISGNAAATGHNIIAKTTADAIFAEMDRRCLLKPEEMIANVTLRISHALNE